MSAEAQLQSGDVVERASWFGPAERPMFGWFVYPRDRRVRGAVVLCQPIAEEANMAYRTFRTLSVRLAEAGFLALRFDYDGTGDSAGGFEDPAPVARWTGSVGAAVRAVRQWGVQRVSLVGMRLGATIAHAAAASGDLGIDELVLWDPCVTGRTFLRELQLVHSPWLETRARAPEGWVETPSYRFPAANAAEIRRLAIQPVERGGVAGRVIALTRPDRDDARLRDALDAGVVEWGDAIGQPELLDVPTIAAAVPDETVRQLCARLGALAPTDRRGLTARVRPSARWSEPGGDVVETVETVGASSILFAVRTAPLAGERTADTLVVFLNVARERHLGEGRMWVELARRLAGLGFESIRMDHSGVGDSGVRPGQPEDVVYATEWLSDVAEVAHELRSSARAPRIVGVGVCSSGSSALEAAAGGHIDEAIAVNAFLTLDAEGNPPASWRIFRRQPAWLTRLATAHRRVADRLWTAWTVAWPAAAGLWGPREIVRNGGEVTLLVGADDEYQVHQTPIWRATWGRILDRSGRFRVVRVPDADHSLRVGSGQDQVARAVVARMREISGRERSRESAGSAGRSPARIPVHPGRTS